MYMTLLNNILKGGLDTEEKLKPEPPRTNLHHTSPDKALITSEPPPQHASVDNRGAWKIGEAVEVYSNSRDRWVLGCIVQIAVDTVSEYLVVRYRDYDTGRIVLKNCGRFGQDIRWPKTIESAFNSTMQANSGKKSKSSSIAQNNSSILRPAPCDYHHDNVVTLKKKNQRHATEEPPYSTYRHQHDEEYRGYRQEDEHARGDREYDHHRSRWQKHVYQRQYVQESQNHTSDVRRRPNHNYNDRLSPDQYDRRYRDDDEQRRQRKRDDREWQHREHNLDHHHEQIDRERQSLERHRNRPDSREQQRRNRSHEDRHAHPNPYKQSQYEHEDRDDRRYNDDHKRQYHYPYEDQIDDYPDRGQTFASYAENDPSFNGIHQDDFHPKQRSFSPNRQRLPDAFQDGLAHHERNYESQRKHEPNRHDYVSREYVRYPSPQRDFYESPPRRQYWREHSVSPEPYYSPEPYHSPRSRGGHTSHETRSRGRSRGRGKLRSRGRGRLKRDISPQRRSISPVHVSRGSGNSRGARTRGRGSRRRGR